MTLRTSNYSRPILEVRELHVAVGENEILKGLTFSVASGEVHAIMGPNGSGKSTFTNVVAGRPGYTITRGDILYEGESILGMFPDERARRGIFLALQYPVELPGIRNREFLRTALEALREARGEPKLAIREFNKVLEAKAKAMDFDPDLMKRNVNEGFSGGEKKRNEILQMTVLDPKLALLDEADFEAFEREAGGPEWLREMRREGIARFRELGLPTAREGNEPWKYTNVAPIAKTEFAYHSDGREAVVDLRSIAPQNNDWATLVFVNGRASRVDASRRDASTTSLVATTLAEAITTHEDTVRRHLAGYATPDYDGFTALNTAFLSDGAYVRVPQEESAVAPVHIVYASANGAEPTVSYPRTLIVAESMSKLTIIETYTGAPGSRYFTDAVTEIVLGEGAQVDHYRLLLESTDAYHVGVTRVYQGRDSSFRSTCVTP